MTDAHTSRSEDGISLASLQSAGITVLERGWLSSNNVLIQGEGPTTLVDSGYSSHANQTLALVSAALGGKPLDQLLNTHLHSDHCGGNASLQQTYPALKTCIPPGQAKAVREWDPVALTYEPTGQMCPRFTYSELLSPGSRVQMGSRLWDVHAAKGHDPHSVVLFQPDLRVLISADALWENGFGIVFPELEGESAFDEVAQTLDLIERLDPSTIIPGHGSVFYNLPAALERARSRLQQFTSQPERHRRHALKVLIKFKLLEWQSVSIEALQSWVLRTPHFTRDLPKEASASPQACEEWIHGLLSDLERANALRRERDLVINV